MRLTPLEFQELQARMNAKQSNPSPITAPNLKVAERPTTDETRLNKTERNRLTYLRSLTMQHLISCLHIQAITLKIGDDCRFTPDFSYVDKHGILTLEDVKGHMRDDALVKLKAVARKFTEFRFMVVKKQINGWDSIEIKP